jgi:hypothetical protein
MDVFNHGSRLTDHLALTVSDLELHCGKVFDRTVPPRDQLCAAIRKIWPQVVAEARDSKVSSEVVYVAGLYDRVCNESRITNPGRFTDRTDVPWHDFYAAGCGGEARCEEAWVIAELYWGGYINYLHLTLGWLLMNGLRIKQGLPAFTPAPETTDRFADYLRWSGPDAFDAESLRALLYEYERRAGG